MGDIRKRLQACAPYAYLNRAAAEGVASKMQSFRTPARLFGTGLTAGVAWAEVAARNEVLRVLVS
jgi:hypothetical protein